MAWLGVWFGLFNTWDGVWSNGVGRNRETDEKHDGNCDEEGFHLTRVKLARDSVGDREARGVKNSSIHIWDGSELELAWS